MSDTGFTCGPFAQAPSHNVLTLTHVKDRICHICSSDINRCRFHGPGFSEVRGPSQIPGGLQSCAVVAAPVSYPLWEFFALCQEQLPVDSVSTEEQHPQFSLAMRENMKIIQQLGTSSVGRVDSLPLVVMFKILTRMEEMALAESSIPYTLAPVF